MVLLQPLVAEQRTVSQKNHNRDNLINRASYMRLGESVFGKIGAYSFQN